MSTRRHSNDKRGCLSYESLHSFSRSAGREGDSLTAQVSGTMGRNQLSVVSALALLALAAPIQAITDADILNFAL